MLSIAEKLEGIVSENTTSAIVQLMLPMFARVVVTTERFAVLEMDRLMLKLHVLFPPMSTG